jgi:hypothetical protein
MQAAGCTYAAMRFRMRYMQADAAHMPSTTPETDISISVCRKTGAYTYANYSTTPLPLPPEFAQVEQHQGVQLSQLLGQASATAAAAAAAAASLSRSESHPDAGGEVMQQVSWQAGACSSSSSSSSSCAQGAHATLPATYTSIKQQSRSRTVFCTQQRSTVSSSVHPRANSHRPTVNPSTLKPLNPQPTLSPACHPSLHALSQPLLPAGTHQAQPGHAVGPGAQVKTELIAAAGNVCGL